MKIKSKLIKENDILSFKPKELKKTIPSLKIILAGFGVEVDQDDIEEYFINKNRTFIRCNIDFKGTSEEVKENLLKIAEKYFYPINENHLTIKLKKGENKDSYFNTGHEQIHIENEDYEIYFTEQNIFILNFIINNLYK